MEHLSKRINSLSSSQTIAMNTKSREMQMAGIDVINLSVGEPDFPTPDHIKTAAKKAIDDNFSFYPPVAGYLDLRKAICQKFKTMNNLDFTPDQIVVSTGAKHSIVNILMCIINPGDEVIVPAPYWVSYLEMVKIAEGVNVIVDTTVESNYKMSPDQLENAISQKTRALLLCSPNNPTGSLYSEEELKGLVAVLKKHPDIYVISDEIYELINFTGKYKSIGDFDEIRDRVVTVNGVSKAYAMTGYRIGYLGAPLWIAKAVTKLQGQMTSGSTTIAMRAALEALTGDQKCTSDMNAAFLRRRDLMLGHLNNIPGLKFNVPEGAFYVFPDVSSYYGKSFNGTTMKNSEDLCVYLLEKAHIATVPGDAFGAPANIRISYANSDDNLNKAMDRLRNALADLK
jgi:aspartate aminotransferase